VLAASGSAELIAYCSDNRRMAAVRAKYAGSTRRRLSLCNGGRWHSKNPGAQQVDPIPNLQGLRRGRVAFHKVYLLERERT
jgi:hypothetical protein